MAHVGTVVGRLWVEARGEGPPVAFWHSLLCDGEMWRAQAEDLARDHRVILIDGPGHGRSGPPARGFSIADCGRALVEVLEDWASGPAVLVGLSWGAMTALHAALLAPERVRALALFDASARAEPLRARLRYRAMAWIYRRIGLARFLERPVLEAMLGPTTRRERPELGRAIVERIRGWDRAGVAEAVRAVIVERETFLDRLGRLAMPALVAVGEEDRTTPPSESERIAAAIPGARLVRIPRAGHLTALEAPAEVTRILREFLEPSPARRRS